MGVRFFTCKNCHQPSSEYNEVKCQECGNSLCDCAIPQELKDYFDCWDSIWSYIDVDDEDNIVAREGYEDYLEVFKKYLTYDSNTYGIVLKEEYCPLCQKRKENEKDPEYREYLRLKEKFERC